MKRKICNFIFTLISVLTLFCTFGFASCAPDSDSSIKEEEDLSNYADVFIFMGQSNMSGQGNYHGAPVFEAGRCFEYRATSGSDAEGWLYDAQEPFGKTEGDSLMRQDARTGGLVSTFMESYQRETGVNVIGVSASYSGSSITEWVGNGSDASYSPKNYLLSAKSRLESCLQYVETESSYELRKINMVWCQGCSDAWNYGNFDTDYKPRLDFMLEEMRSVESPLGNKVDKCMIITISGYSKDSNDQHYVKTEKINMIQKQIEMCQTDEDYVLISQKFTDAPIEFADGPHFYQAVYNVCGWDAGKNAAFYAKTGGQADCKPYRKGEATELSKQLNFPIIDQSNRKNDNPNVVVEEPSSNTDTSDSSSSGGTESPDVPTDKSAADVFIFMGQANMSGHGNADGAPVFEVGHAYEYRAETGSDSKGWLYAVKEPFGATEKTSLMNDASTGGMVSAFCEAYYRYTGTAVVAVCAVMNNYNIETCLSNGYVDKAAERLTACLAYLQSDDSPYYAANVNMVWCHGCSDAWNYANFATKYQPNLNQVFLKMEAVGVRNCLVVSNGIHTKDGTETVVNNNKLQMSKAQVDFCNSDGDDAFTLVSQKFIDTPTALADQYQYLQCIYNVVGWDAGMNAGRFLKDGILPSCSPYQSGEATALAEQLVFAMIDNKGNAITEN